MAKSYTQYICQDCGYSNPRYLGRCPNCGNWDTMAEERIEKSSPSSSASSARFNATSVPRPIQDIHSDEEKRMQLKHQEFSRVLGGGLVPGSINLIGGDPGIGKSTLLLQIALEIAENETVLYVSGEESERQIKMRADRLQRDQDGKVHPLMRKGESEYKDNSMSNPSLSSVQLIELMHKHPKVIERPIVVFKDKAIIGRPPENVLNLI